jgi:hypothetical protein
MVLSYLKKAVGSVISLLTACGILFCETDSKAGSFSLSWHFCLVVESCLQLTENAAQGLKQIFQAGLLGVRERQ